MLLIAGWEASRGGAGERADSVSQVYEYFYVVEALPPTVRQARKPKGSARQRAANRTGGSTSAAQVYGFDERGLGGFCAQEADNGGF